MIRKLQKEDLEIISCLEERVLGETIGVDLLNDSLTNSAYDFRVYIKDNKIIGYISTCFVLDFGDIYNFCIEKEYQRLGIGTELLNSILLDHPNTNISLEVRESNIQAISFYRKNNFEIRGRRKAYYSNKEDALIMVRKN